MASHELLHTLIPLLNRGSTWTDCARHGWQVWPGPVHFPDFSNPRTLEYWQTLNREWYDSGARFHGLWIDMNEPSNFVPGAGGAPSKVLTACLTVPEQDWQSGGRQMCARCWCSVVDVQQCLQHVLQWCCHHVVREHGWGCKSRIMHTIPVRAASVALP